MTVFGALADDVLPWDGCQKSCVCTGRLKSDCARDSSDELGMPRCVWTESTRTGSCSDHSLAVDGWL